MSDKNRRGEVYESWVNSFGCGTLVFIIFVVIFILTMAGVIL